MLLLGVFTIVNVSVLVLRRDPARHRHFRTPTPLPALGAIVSLVLIADNYVETFLRSGILLLVAFGLWSLNRRLIAGRSA